MQPQSHNVRAPVLHLRSHCLSQAAVPPITARTHHHSNKTAEEMLEIVLSIITIKLITSSSLQSCSVSPPGILQGIRTGTNIHNDGVFRSCLSKAIHRAAALSVREHHTAAAQSCSHFHFSSEVTWNLLGQRVGKKHEMWAPWHREIRRYRNGFDVSIRF